MNDRQTIYGTSYDCPNCHHKEEGLHSDGKHLWCNQCGYGKDFSLTYSSDEIQNQNTVDGSS